MNQGRRHRRINPSGESQDHPLFTDLRADGCNRLVNVIGHGPVTASATQRRHKAAKDRGALLGVGHFRMKLNAIKTAILIGHASNRTRFGRGHQLKSGWQ